RRGGRPPLLKITLDTNSVRLDEVGAAVHKIRGGGDSAITTTLPPENRPPHHPSLPETHILFLVWVMGASPMGVTALAQEADRDLFEATLAAITNGSFPKPGSRSALTQGERRQLRDAIIFCTHVREGREGGDLPDSRQASPPSAPGF